MIGVISTPGDAPIVEEFFELFKTPWEFYVAGRFYDVVLVADAEACIPDAKLAIVFGSHTLSSDLRERTAPRGRQHRVSIQSGGVALPIYGDLLTFESGSGDALCLTSNSERAVVRFERNDAVVIRAGYDLFAEVRFLLGDGQPLEYARVPSLDLHIDLLRQWILDRGLPLTEVPATPYGCRFIVCLTHDIDFVGVGRLGWNHTLLGFLARASVGTLVDVVRGRRPIEDVKRNWLAILSLPFVRLGLLPDFWHPFEDYDAAEGRLRSTYFLVPFKERPGIGPDGNVDPKRSVTYQASEIGEVASATAARGNELGVHGIDAWRDSAAGRNELNEVTSITGTSMAGIRMHWLYFDAESPVRIEAAGFDYDSTCGYNEAVGYRAGTSQVFQIPGTKRLMELPMAIMDSALFSSGRMRLSHDAALAECREIIANATRFGGTLVINWHCRSLAPERLWDRFYQSLLAEIGANHVWFATGREAVDWFRWRRSIRFAAGQEPGDATTRVSAPPTSRAGVIRIHHREAVGTGVEDIEFDGQHVTEVMASQTLSPTGLEAS